MSRGAQFFGIIGLLAIVFGLLTQLLIVSDDFHLVAAHFVVGLGCLVVFLISGGHSALQSAAAKRVAGFGAGVFVYSVLFFGVLGAANYLVLRHDPLFVDTTAEKVFTLAPQTQKILAALTKPVMVRAFYVGKIDAVAEALLNRYAKASPNFRWVFIDPEKRPKLMDEFGISQSATLHFAFEDEPAGRSTKIVREITEQEITNAIIKLTRGGTKTLYALTGHGEADLDKPNEAGFLFLKDAIQGENLKLEKLTFSETQVVPPDADGLLVLAPKKDLLPIERDAITAYLKRGGHAMFVAEPRSTSAVADLVKPLGIKVGNDIIVDQVVSAYGGLGVQPIIANFAMHPSVEGFDKSIAMSTASSVTKAPDAPPGVTEIAFTGRNSWAESDLDQIFSEKPTASLDPNDIRGPVSVVAAFDGVYPGAQNGETGGRDGATEKKPAAEDQPHTRVIVVGDIDFVANINLRKLFNADFFLNLMNWTIGEKEGVTIRAGNLRNSRAAISREQFGMMFVLSAILVPELLLAGGLGIWCLRRRS